MKILLSVSLLLLLAVAGCGGQGGGDQAEPASHETPPAAEKAEAEFVAMEGEMDLEGALGCGHCNHHIGTSCSAALQTADGTVFILDVENDHELFTDRFGGKQVKVSGIVQDVEKVHHVRVLSYELM